MARSKRAHPNKQNFFLEYLQCINNTTSTYPGAKQSTSTIYERSFQLFLLSLFVGGGGGGGRTHLHEHAQGPGHSEVVCRHWLAAPAPAHHLLRQESRRSEKRANQKHEAKLTKVDQTRKKQNQTKPDQNITNPNLNQTKTEPNQAKTQTNRTQTEPDRIKPNRTKPN